MDILPAATAFRAARINCRLTQQDIARGTGVSVVTVSRLNGGRVSPDRHREVAQLVLVGRTRSSIPDHLAHVRTLDDIQRERTLASAAVATRSNLIKSGSAATSFAQSSPGAITQRARKNIDIEPRKNQRVRHSKIGITRG